mgnify:CR=1 FL=1
MDALAVLCFRGIAHQHSLIAPTSEQTFSSWNERSNLYIGIGKQSCSGSPILKVPCTLDSWNNPSRVMFIGKPSLYVTCASVSDFKGKDLGRWTNDGQRTRGERRLVQHVVQHFLLSFCWTKCIWSIDGRTTAWMFMLPMFRCCLHLGLEVGTAWEPGEKVTKNT